MQHTHTFSTHPSYKKSYQNTYSKFYLLKPIVIHQSKSEPTVTNKQLVYWLSVCLKKKKTSNELAHVCVCVFLWSEEVRVEESSSSRLDIKLPGVTRLARLLPRIHQRERGDGDEWRKRPS